MLAYLDGGRLGRQDTILDLLRMRFGDVSPEVEVRVRAEHDLKKLHAALLTVLHITSPDEFAL